MKGSTSAVVPKGALERLIVLIRERTGNHIPPARHGFLEEITARRTRAHGIRDASEYVHALATDQLDGEWEQLISLVTVKESYFFRAPQQFRAIERHVLPRLMASRAEDETLEIWSAAAARGEEPATLAMILAEHEALSSWSWRILATDVDRDALAAAERGLYGERAVSQVPERLLDRWFTRRGGLYELSPAIRSRIEYRPYNLSQMPYRSLGSRPFDLILLRNVLIYFHRPLQRRVVSEVMRSFAPDGYLFLGASETLWQIFDRLAPVDLGRCFAYRHPDRVEPAERAARRPPTGPKRPASAGRIDSAGREISTGGHATEAEAPSPEPGRDRRRRRFRIPPRADQPLGVDEAAGAAEREPEPVPERAPPPLDDTTVSDEVRGDDSDHPPVPVGGSAQDLLLEAAEALADNRVERATSLTAAARDADPSEPAVYALEGFLHDLQRRANEASGAYRAALYLDPGLYQVRVLLADCMARLGNRDRAENEYREVLAVLDRGGARDLVLLEDLPFPNRRRALRLCRQALGRR